MAFAIPARETYLRDENNNCKMMLVYGTEHDDALKNHI
jgi:hypothetical protein